MSRVRVHVCIWEACVRACAYVYVYARYLLGKIPVFFACKYVDMCYVLVLQLDREQAW